MFRIYVERKEGFESEAQRIYSEITGFLGITGVKKVRYLNRYDIENTSDAVLWSGIIQYFFNKI